MFRNLPPKFTLSAGFGAKDYWAVSLNDIDGLRVIPPDGYEGAFTLEVLLVKGQGVDPERRAAQVAFTGDSPASPMASASDNTKLLTASRPEETTGSIQALEPRRQSTEPTEIDQSMQERGDTYLKQGDIAAARLLYKQLAKKGIAHGAFAHGQYLRSRIPGFARRHGAAARHGAGQELVPDGRGTRKHAGGAAARGAECQGQLEHVRARIRQFQIACVPPTSSGRSERD